MKDCSALFRGGFRTSSRSARLSDMRRILLIALVLAVSASAADARRRHHHRWHRAPVMMIGPNMDMPRETRGRGRPRESGCDSYILADWNVPRGMQNFSARRYMAPDGSAWLALYSAPAD